MSDLKAILFEDPLPLQLLCGLAAIVGAILWRRRRTFRTLLIVVCPLVLIVALTLLAAAVTTETERLSATLDRFIAAVREGDLTAAADLIDDTYSDGVYTKAEAVAKIDQTRRTIGLTDLQIASVEKNVGDTDAVVAFRAIIRATHSMAMYESFPTRWRLWWVRRPAGWRVRSSRLDDPAGIGGAPRGP